MATSKSTFIYGALAGFLAVFVLIFLLSADRAYADGNTQVVKSDWIEVTHIEENYPYYWAVRMTLTVEDGVVTDAVCAAQGSDGYGVMKGGGVPPMHQPYYSKDGRTGQKQIMETYIAAAELDASDPDSVDDVDVVSGATHTSTAIKKAAKSALVNWNAKKLSTQGVVDDIEAIASAPDKAEAVKAARDAYNALGSDLQSYVASGVYAILIDAEQAIAVAKAEAAAEANLANATVTLKSSKLTYTGKALTPAVTVKSKGSATLKQGADFTVKYAKNTNVGIATVTVTGKGKFTGSKSATFTIAAAKQTIKAAKTYSVKAVKVKKKAQAIAVKFNASGKGKVTYAKAKSGKVSIAKNGKVTVAKGAKKGTYTLKVKVTAAAKGNYAKTTVTVPLKVKVS